VKDSTDDLWFLESATDDDDNGSVFANELDLVSDVDNVADSDSEKDSILPDEVGTSFVCITINYSIMCY